MILSKLNDDDDGDRVVCGTVSENRADDLQCHSGTVELSQQTWNIRLPIRLYRQKNRCCAYTRADLDDLREI